jgi:hypothetical protein
MRRTLWLALAAWMLVGCATTESDLRTLRGRVTQQRNDLKAAKASADAAEAQIKTVGKKSSSKRMYIGKSAMLGAIKGNLPHHFSGKSLSRKHLKGKFQFKKARGFKFLSRNRATWTWDFAASKVAVNLKGVPMTSKKDERKARDALQGGGTMNMSASVWVDWKKKVLRINTRCVSVKLRKNNTARHRDMLCDGANKKLFNRQQAVKLPAVFRGKKVMATTTPYHLILISK